MIFNLKIKKEIFKDPSLRSLIFSNLLTIFIALIENWNFFAIFLVYLFQSFIIGFFNFIRIFWIKEFFIKLPQIKLFQKEITFSVPFLIKFFFAIFFFIHYNGFLFGYWLIVISIINYGNFSRDFDESSVFFSILIFFLNHLFSFLYNKTKDEKKVDIREFINYPYRRVVLMHITLFLAGLSFIFLKGEIVTKFLLIIFLLLKTYFDAKGHIQKHAVWRRETNFIVEREENTKTIKRVN